MSEIECQVSEDIPAALKEIYRFLDDKTRGKFSKMAVSNVLLINGINYQVLCEKKKVKLKDGDVISFVPLVSGG